MRGDWNEGRGREWSSDQQEARDERADERRAERPQPGRYERDERNAGMRDREMRGMAPPRRDRHEPLDRDGRAWREPWSEPWERDVAMRTEDPDWRNQERSAPGELHRAGRLGGYYDRLDFGGEERSPVGGWERPDYGFGQWGMDEQSDWRGPGDMPGYRENDNPRRVRPFSPSSSRGGQVPSEIREWGRRGDRGERRIGGERSARGLYPMRDPWRRGPAGPGPDADRGPDGQRRSLSGPARERGRELPRGPHAGRGPKSYRRDDARIHEDVCDRLAAHPRIDASDIEVEVAGGKVVLRGAVPDRATKHRAEDLVDAVLGVSEVDNQLRVGRGAPAGSHAGTTFSPGDRGEH